MRPARRAGHSGMLVCILLVALLAATVGPALARVPAVEDLSSTSHPSAEAWYSDDSVALSWSDPSGVPTLTASVSTAGYAQDVVVDGTTAYVADWSGGLLTLDVSEPGTPTVLSALSVKTPIRCVAFSGKHVFGGVYSDTPSDRELLVVDASDPTSPQVEATLQLDSPPTDIEVVGDIAYVASDFGAINIVDISDPASPTVIGQTSTWEAAWIIGVADGTLYVGKVNDLMAFDVSDPTNPVEKYSLTLPDRVTGGTVVGDMAVLACQYAGMQIVDISGPGAPSIVGTYDTDGFTSDIIVRGDVAYLLENKDNSEMDRPVDPEDLGVLAVDISDPSSPVELDRCSWETGYSGAIVAAGYVLLAADGRDLRVVSIGDSGASRLLGEYPAGHRSYELNVAGTDAYVASGSYGLEVIDFSDPTQPVLAGSYDSAGYARSLTSSGTYVYLVDDADDGEEEPPVPADAPGLKVVDVSDPSSPTLAGSCQLPAGGADAAVDKDTVFVAVGSTVKSVDVSDPASPTPVGELSAPGYVYGVAASNGWAYIALGSAGVRSVDASDPASPALIGSFDTTGIATDLTVAGDVLFVADDSGGLVALDIHEPGSPVYLGDCDTQGRAKNVSVTGDVAVVSLESGGVCLVDVSSPESMSILGVVGAPGSVKDAVLAGDVIYAACFTTTAALRVSPDETLTLPTEGAATASAVTVSGDVAYLAAGSNGVQSVDLSDPARPVLLDTLDTPGSVRRVSVDGDVAFVADGSSGLRLIDVTDPASMATTGSVATNDSAYDAVPAGRYVFVADGLAGLSVVDASDPTSPALLGSCDTPGRAQAVSVWGDLAVVADWNSGVRTIDISEPGTPTLLGGCATTDYAYDVAAAGGFAFVAAGSDGLAVVDLSSPAAPTVVASLDLAGTSKKIRVDGGLAYLAAGADGIHVVDISDPLAPKHLETVFAPGGASDVEVPGALGVAATPFGAQCLDLAIGPVAYSFTLEQDPWTMPDIIADSTSPSFEASGLADGEWYFHVRCVGEARRGGPVSHRRIGIDTVAPVTTSDVVASYVDEATISLIATDAVSGVEKTWYSVDGGEAVEGTTIHTSIVGTHTVEYWSRDKAGNVEDVNERTFRVDASSVRRVEVAGTDRYKTAVEASKEAFDSASTVVIATGLNWPDALGGAALAGVVDGPVLLTAPDAVPSVVLSEIRRLKATDAYILGGEGAVSAEVEQELKAELSGTVTRLAGSNRYQTAKKVADEVVRLQGSDYDGKVFVCTGGDFPDALGASPLSARYGIPVILVAKDGNPALPAGTQEAIILGGPNAVTDVTQQALEGRLGAANVLRLKGTDRFSTAVKVAQHGVGLGMHWDGVGFATGLAFPDALSGGPMLAEQGSVLLLTRPDELPTVVENRLTSEKQDIGTVRFLGGPKAITESVRTRVEQILEK
ncbi:MAG: hypothetical protein Kow0056_11860 [Coriobacteriia bacterium]